jgi:hypothetical protein
MSERSINGHLSVPDLTSSYTLPQTPPRGAHLGVGPSAVVAETRCTLFFA